MFTQKESLQHTEKKMVPQLEIVSLQVPSQYISKRFKVKSYFFIIVIFIVGMTYKTERINKVLIGFVM